MVGDSQCRDLLHLPRHDGQPRRRDAHRYHHRHVLLRYSRRRRHDLLLLGLGLQQGVWRRREVRTDGGDGHCRLHNYHDSSPERDGICAVFRPARMHRQYGRRRVEPRLHRRQPRGELLRRHGRRIADRLGVAWR